nr:MAG TPA: hypothetical protein [Caudoviricetes sp.]
MADEETDIPFLDIADCRLCDNSEDCVLRKSDSTASFSN